MEAPSAHRSESNAKRFEQDVAHTLGLMRRAFGALIDSLPGPVRGAGDLQRILGLDKQLSWQVFRVGSVADPVEAGADVPRSAGVARAMRAAATRGVPDQLIEAVNDVCRQYEALVERHAGDRTSFDAMVRGLRTKESQVHLKERRAAFRANIAVWGIQVATHYNLAVFHANAAGTQEDNVGLFGCVGFRKIRAGAGGHVMAHQSGSWATTDAGCGAATPEQFPALTLLDSYSTKPFPPIETREIPDGKTELRFNSDVVGKKGELTYFLRDFSQGVGDMPQPWWGNMSLSMMPTEVGILDMLVPKGWSDPKTARVSTYGNLRNFQRIRECKPEDLLPVTEQVQYLGNSLDMLRTPRVPKCDEMAAEAIRVAGWASTPFDIYRCVIEYPILCAGTGIRVDAAK